MEQDLSGGGRRATAREWIGLAVLAGPCLLYSMDLTVLYLAVPQISAAMRPSASELLWIVDIYGFMVAGFLVTMGTLGDRIGRRRLLLIGAAAFGATSALAAFSTSPEMLIAARALQGIAAATLAPSTLALIRNMFIDERERTFAIGVWVASFSAGAALGPVFGGLILSAYWWGAVFLINVPLMIVLLALGPRLLPEYRDPEAGRLDLFSALQSLIAVLLLMYGVKGVAEHGATPLHAAAVFAGVGVGAMFVWRQNHLPDPLIDVRLFRDPRISAALTINVAGLFAVLGSFLLIAQYLQFVLGMGPLEAGLWTAPSGVVFALGSMATPALLRRYSPAAVIATGFCIAAVGFGVLTALPGAEGPWMLFSGMLILCAGCAPIGTTTTDIVMTAAPPERAGAASAISETSFEFGGAAGIAVLGSIVTAIYGAQLGSADLATVNSDARAAAIGTLGGALEVAKSLPAEEGARLTAAARDAFVTAMAATSAIAAASTLAAAAFAWATLRPRR